MKQDEITIRGENIPINILLADDDEDDRHFFGRILKEIHINTRFATVENGEKLMQYLIKNSSNPPNILFIDFNMPCKNGLQCLSEIYLNEKLRHLPVIVYSNSVQEKYADLLYDKGAYYYVRKTDLEQLKKHVQHILTMMIDNKLVKPRREEFIVVPLKYNA